MYLSVLNDGGPIFMYPLSLFFILVLVLIVKGFVGKDNNTKTISLISSISLFALVWGFLGQILGLIGAFDAIESAGDISPSILAGGLKISLLSPAFGMTVFLVGRLGIIAITWIQKNN